MVDTGEPVMKSPPCRVRQLEQFCFSFRMAAAM